MTKPIAVAAALLLCDASRAAAGEPARTVLLQNDKVVVVEVAFAPGDEEPQHAHPQDVVVVALTAGGIESTDADGKVELLVPKVGDVHFFPKASVHRSRNAGKERVVLRAILF